MDDLKQLSAITALNHMMSKGHFSLCAIDSVAKLLNVDPHGEAYDILRPLHCIDWAEMPEQLRDAVPSLIQRCLGVAPAFKFSTLKQRTIEVSPAPQSKTAGVLLRLMGGRG
jgi:hypothetical protein